MLFSAKLSKTKKDFHCALTFRFRYRDPCSLSLNEDDNHTITLVGNANKKAVTLAKTCEQVNELRDCRAPRDWSILALQNTRTGKSHYLVICKCPSNFRLGEFPKRVSGSTSDTSLLPVPSRRPVTARSADLRGTPRHQRLRNAVRASKSAHQVQPVEDQPAPCHPLFLPE